MVRRAQEKMLSMKDSLVELIMKQATSLDQLIQLMEETNKLQRQLISVMPQLVHALEKVNVNGVLARVQSVLRPLRISPSNWTHPDPLEFLK